MPTRTSLAVLAALLIIGLSGAGSAGAQPLTWRSFEEALAVADTSGRPVLVDVYAPWCGWCRQMKHEVYPSREVRACLAEDFVLTRLNHDDRQTTHRYQGRTFTSMKLARHLGAASVPTLVLLDAQGRALLRLPGFVEAEALRPVLRYIATEAYRRQPFEAFLSQEPADEEGC